MVRVYNILCDTVTAVCAAIVAWYTVFPTATLPVTQVSTSPTPIPPLWIIGIGAIGVALLISRWGPPLFQSVRHKFQKPTQQAVEFFQTRFELDKRYSSLESRIKASSSIWAIWTTGTRFIDSSANKNSLKRLILPDPGSAAAIFYFDTIEQNHGRVHIRQTTEKAIKSGVEVRWSSQFIFHAITIADPNSPDGWAHIEHALPYCTTERRLGYTINRRDQPEAMNTLIEIFEKMWAAHKTPTDDEARTLGVHLVSAQESRIVPIWQAVAHVRAAINDTDQSKFYPETRKVLRQAALDGKIKLRGRREIDAGRSQAFSDVSADIPSEYWKVSVISVMATAQEGFGGYPHTDPETGYAWGPKGILEKNRYADLTADMQEIKRQWHYEP